jgi:FkbH-like protein
LCRVRTADGFLVSKVFHREQESPNLSTDVTREQIDLFIDAGDPAAGPAMAAFWRQSPGTGSAAFIVKRFEMLRDKIHLTRRKLAILRSFTIEPAVPLLRAAAFTAGLDLDVQIGDFNTYAQEVIDPASKLYAFSPDIVILAAHTADIAPELWENFADLDAAAVQSAIERVTAEIQQIIRTFRGRSTAHLIIHSLQSPAIPALGLLDAQLECGQREAIARINAAIGRLARENRNVYVLDYNALIGRRGQEQWDDRRKWVTARMPIAAGELLHLANTWLRFLLPLAGKVCKAIAIDLDNTLWGGVIGEDGIDGIKVGDDHHGIAYRDVQRALLDLYRRGILLAVCSKNNPAEAVEAIAKHPGMLLRPEHFACIKTNWEDKASNLRQIATELNIGIDSIAFLDDNPVERDWVRKQLPEVTVIDLPADPMAYAKAIRDAGVFERLTLSAEDRERGRYYAEQRQRTELQQAGGTIEDFYRSLEMKVQIAAVTPQSLPRAAQLTQKTNQFNVTTRRYSEEQMASLLSDPHWIVRTIRVVDRFGDNGMVGLAMVKLSGQAAEIDNFLLSCRVIGRTVETAFLAELIHQARQSGAQRIIGRFIPTKKNAPAQEFFPLHGFQKSGDSNGESEWLLTAVDSAPTFPSWIERID